MRYAICAECGDEDPKDSMIEVRVFGKVKTFCSDECWRHFQKREFSTMGKSDNEDIPH